MLGVGWRAEPPERAPTAQAAAARDGRRALSPSCEPSRQSGTRCECGQQLPSGSVTHLGSVVIDVVKHTWNVAVDGHKPFRRDKHRGTGSGVILYIRECFDF